MSKPEEYSGPETNDVYSNEDGEFESFDDLGDDTFEESDIQGGTSDQSFDNEDEDDEHHKSKKKESKDLKAKKKEEAKKAKGQKGDDIDMLETLDDSEFDDEEEETEEVEEEETEEEESAEEEKEVKEEAKKPKGKPTYLTIDGETFAVPSDSLIPVQVDGKTEKLTLQELKNHFAGKVAWDKKFNEVNVKEQTIKKTEAELNKKVGRFDSVKQQIEQIITDPEKDPEDALKIFLDAFDIDSYDLMERSFKSKLSELSKILLMETEAERKAYFLEKKTGHLLNQAEKRKAREVEDARVNSYRQKTDALRKSSNVSEAQYVDAYEELISFGYKDEELKESEVVEWAATKPHREKVSPLMEPYKDQLSSDAYGELSWKLAKILQSGAETPETIKKHLAEVYGVPTEVKKLSKKLTPVGRKPVKSSAATSKKIQSFDDIDEDDE